MMSLTLTCMNSKCPEDIIAKILSPDCTWTEQTTEAASVSLISSHGGLERVKSLRKTAQLFCVSLQKHYNAQWPAFAVQLLIWTRWFLVQTWQRKRKSTNMHTDMMLSPVPPTQKFIQIANLSLCLSSLRPLKIRKINDQLMLLDRAFLDPLAFPDKYAYRYGLPVWKW